MAEPSRGKKRRRLNYNKCRFCRTAKKACTPVERAWPEKCQRCTELELDCSENTRAAGASTPIAAQLSNETINIQTIRNLSLGVACMARLKSYINAIDIVWDTQDKLFSGWRNRVHVPLRRDIIEPREALLFNKFFSEMLISNHPLAAVMVHAVMTGPSFLQRFPSGRPLVPVNELVNYFRENNDVGTALAIEEIRLLQWFESVPRRTNTARLLGYCEMYLETTDRLKAILEDGVSCMPPPLHYFLLLAKEKNLSFPITPALSEFIRMKDHFGRSLVHMTLDLGLTENVLPLIKLGISATSGDVWGRRPIHIACLGNSEAALKHVLDQTVDCEVEDSLGRSALHYASSCGNESAVRLLLDRGGSVHHKDQDGRVPILWAVEHGHSAVVQLLLSNRPAIDCGYGSIAFLTATKLGHADIVHALIEKGADVNTKNSFDQTALSEAAGAGHISTVEALLRNGASLHERDIHGETALNRAARGGHVSIVELLLRNGARIHEADHRGHTALYSAARNGHAGIVEILIRNGADIDERDNFSGVTALDRAIHSRHVDTIKVLLDNGADINNISPHLRNILTRLMVAETI